VAFRLQFTAAGGRQVNRSISALVIVTLCTLGAWTAGAWHASLASSVVDVAPVAAPQSPSTAPSGDHGWSDLPVPLIEELGTDAQQDIYGNDVSHAIASYKRDPAGALYEEHSPRTEVPRLKPPTT
jgi:hypothetical protein